MKKMKKKKMKKNRFENYFERDPSISLFFFSMIKYDDNYIENKDPWYWCTQEE